MWNSLHKVLSCVRCWAGHVCLFNSDRCLLMEIWISTAKFRVHYDPYQANVHSVDMQFFCSVLEFIQFTKQAENDNKLGLLSAWFPTAAWCIPWGSSNCLHWTQLWIMLPVFSLSSFLNHMDVTLNLLPHITLYNVGTHRLWSSLCHSRFVFEIQSIYSEVCIRYFFVDDLYVETHIACMFVC